MTEIEKLKLQVAHYYKEAIEATTIATHYASENERMRDMIQQIADWQKAYPIEVFLEPDFKRAAEVLKDAGITLDAISASNMRHVLNGIKKIVDIGLGNNE